MYWFIDCCLPNSYGEASFKGSYTYPISLVNTKSQLPCVYNRLNTTSRDCILTNAKAEWKIPDLSNCPAKSEATNNLISLDKVRNK